MWIYRNKNLQNWKYWHHRKLFFCFLSGVVYAFIAAGISFITRYTFFRTDTLWDAVAGVGGGAFIGGCFFSLAIWYENERKYKKHCSDN